MPTTGSTTTGPARVRVALRKGLGVVFRHEAITPRFLVAAMLVLTALTLRDSQAKPNSP